MKRDLVDILKVVLTCVLLKMTFDPVTAGRCLPCSEGYFVTRNCSINNDKKTGVQCGRCTDCSAVHQDTLVPCSTFTDSLCGNKTTASFTSMPTGTPVSAPELWIIISVIVFSLLLVLLLGLFLTLLSCRYRQHYKAKGLDQL